MRKIRIVVSIIIALILFFHVSVGQTQGNNRGFILLKDSNNLEAPGNAPKFSSKTDIYIFVSNLAWGTYVVEVFEPGKQESLGVGEIIIGSEETLFNLYSVAPFEDTENPGGVYYVQVGKVKSKNFKVGPEDPTNPVEPTNPTNPVEPTNPTNPVEPTNPTNPVEPTEPVEPEDPVEETPEEEVEEIEEEVVEEEEIEEEVVEEIEEEEEEVVEIPDPVLPQTGSANSTFLGTVLLGLGLIIRRLTFS